MLFPQIKFTKTTNVKKDSKTPCKLTPRTVRAINKYVKSIPQYYSK